MSVRVGVAGAGYWGKNLIRLGPIVAGEGFYLAGRTTLALRYGHRCSAALDWFSPHIIEDPLVLAARIP